MSLEYLAVYRAAAVVAVAAYEDTAVLAHVTKFFVTVCMRRRPCKVRMAVRHVGKNDRGRGGVRSHTLLRQRRIYHRQGGGYRRAYETGGCADTPTAISSVRADSRTGGSRPYESPRGLSDSVRYGTCAWVSIAIGRAELWCEQ